VYISVRQFKHVWCYCWIVGLLFYNMSAAIYFVYILTALQFQLKQIFIICILSTEIVINHLPCCNQWYNPSILLLPCIVTFQCTELSLSLFRVHAYFPIAHLLECCLKHHTITKITFHLVPLWSEIVVSCFTLSFLWCSFVDFLFACVCAHSAV